MYDKILKSFENHNLEKERKIAVAVSGGIDSLSLVLFFKQWAKVHRIKVVGVTVDHCLRKESADEAKYVSKLLKSKKIEHYILKWEGEKPTKNIEAIARTERYNLLTDFCKKQGIEILLVAHHLQDQAETFFIRLFRGSGIDGLASMKKYRQVNDIRIVRPFLKINKEILRQYLLDNKIAWVEDSSNKDERFLRNKIRNFLDSFENKKDILKRIDSAVVEIAKAKNIISHELNIKEKEVLKLDRVRGVCEVDLVRFGELDEDLSLRILAKVLMKVGGNYYKPRLEKLKRIYSKVLKSFKKETFYGCVLQRIDKKKFCVYREYSAIGPDVFLESKKEVFWDKRFKIALNKDVRNLLVTHLKKGEFKSLLEFLKKRDSEKYKELKSLKGIDKEIFYTIPIFRKEGEFLFDLKKFGIKLSFIDL